MILARKTEILAKNEEFAVIQRYVIFESGDSRKSGWNELVRRDELNKDIPASEARCIDWEKTHGGSIERWLKSLLKTQKKRLKKINQQMIDLEKEKGERENLTEKIEKSLGEGG